MEKGEPRHLSDAQEEGVSVVGGRVLQDDPR